MKKPEVWQDQQYPSDPDEAERVAFHYWALNEHPAEAAAEAAIVARRVAEIAKFGLRKQRRG